MFAWKKQRPSSKVPAEPGRFECVYCIMFLSLLPASVANIMLEHPKNVNLFSAVIPSRGTVLPGHP